MKLSYEVAKKSKYVNLLEEGALDESLFQTCPQRYKYIRRVHRATCKLGSQGHHER